MVIDLGKNHDYHPQTQKGMKVTALDHEKKKFLNK